MLRGHHLDTVSVVLKIPYCLLDHLGSCLASFVVVASACIVVVRLVDFENSSNYLNSFATTAFSSTSGTPSLEAESNGKIPKGAKAVYLSAAIRDADSTGGGNCRIYLGKNSTSKYDLQISNDEVPDDQWRYNSGRVGCDSNGDIYYDIDATGSDTLDARIWPLAVQLR